MLEARDDKSFLVRSMLFPGSHINHLMIQQSLEHLLKTESQSNSDLDEIIEHCFPHIVQVDSSDPQHMLSKWAIISDGSEKILQVSMVDDDQEFEADKPENCLTLKIDTP